MATQAHKDSEDQMLNIKISEQLMTEIVNYLKMRPFAEVAGIMQKIGIELNQQQVKKVPKKLIEKPKDKGDKK